MSFPFFNLPAATWEALSGEQKLALALIKSFIVDLKQGKAFDEVESWLTSRGTFSPGFMEQLLGIPHNSVKDYMRKKLNEAQLKQGKNDVD